MFKGNNNYAFSYTSPMLRYPAIPFNINTNNKDFNASVNNGRENLGSSIGNFISYDYFLGVGYSLMEERVDVLSSYC